MGPGRRERCVFDWREQPLLGPLKIDVRPHQQGAARTLRFSLLLQDLWNNRRSLGLALALLADLDQLALPLRLFTSRSVITVVGLRPRTVYFGHRVSRPPLLATRGIYFLFALKSLHSPSQIGLSFERLSLGPGSALGAGVVDRLVKMV